MASYLFIQLSFNRALWKWDLVIAKKKMSKYLEVAKILAVRSIDGGKEYRMRWKGFGSRDDKNIWKGFYLITKAKQQ